MSKIAVIIPVYNEALRLQPEEFTRFVLAHTDVVLFFVNDGSNDQTVELLEKMKDAVPAFIKVLSLPANKGKANAVRQGILMALAEGEFSHIGYLDADLSTSASELYRLYQYALSNQYDYVLGSRVKLLNTVIERSFSRHIAGRMIATLIDSRYRLGVYDTQCGAKCFTQGLARQFVEQSFFTTWFFDVEILLRIRKYQPASRGAEIPLTAWKDPGNSSINFFSFPLVVKEIFSLFTHYPAS